LVKKKKNWKKKKKKLNFMSNSSSFQQDKSISDLGKQVEHLETIQKFGQRHWRTILSGALLVGATLTIIKDHWQHQRLSDHHSILLSLFCDLTSCDPTDAYLILQHHHWHFPSALRAFFLEQNIMIASEHNPHSPSSFSSPDELRLDMEISPQIQSFLSGSTLPPPPDTSWGAFGSSIVSSVLSFIMPIDSETHAQFQTRWATTYFGPEFLSATPLDSSSPPSASSSATAPFPSTLSPLSASPLLFSDSLQSALDESSSRASFLLVYLHSDDHPDCLRFSQSAFSHAGRAILLRRRCLLWPVSVQTSQGQSLAVSCRATMFPFLMLLLRDPLEPAPTTLASFLPRASETPQFLADLDGLTERYAPLLPLSSSQNSTDASSPFLQSSYESQSVIIPSPPFSTSTSSTSSFLYAPPLQSRQQQEQQEQQAILRHQEQEIMRQQERNYAEALSADLQAQRAEAARQEALQRQQRQQEQEQRLALAAQAQKEHEKQLELAAKRQRLPLEPPASQPDSIRLAVLLPSGQRLTRRFSLHDPSLSLYDFIDISCPDLPPYTLVQPFPRQTLEKDNHTFSHHQISDSTLFHIHFLA
jgi:hypothetical protein